MDRYTFIIELGKIIVSMPVLIVALLIIAAKYYKQQVNGLIEFIQTIWRVKAGPVELERKQQEPPADTTQQDTKTDTQSIEEITEKLNQLQFSNANAQAELEAVIESTENAMKDKDQQILHWRLMYLTQFLVPNTKYLLRHIEDNKNLSLSKFMQTAKQLTLDSDQPMVILSTLQNLGLITLDTNNGINTTDLGKTLITTLKFIEPGAVTFGGMLSQFGIGGTSEKQRTTPYVKPV